MKFSAVFFLILLNAICSAQDNVMRYSENGKYRFKDNLDNVIIKAGSYDFLNPIDEEGMILAKKNGREGYINLKEDILIPFIYDNLSVFSANGLAPATINNKSGFINRKGETVIPFVYDGTGWFYDLGLSSVYIGDKGGFVNKEGKIVIPIIYDKVNYNKVDHIVQVKKHIKMGFF